MNKISKAFYEIILGSLSILIAVVILSAILGIIFLPDERDSVDLTLKEYNVGWQRVYPNGYLEDIVIPNSVDVPRRDRLILQNVINIDELEEGDVYLALHSMKQDLKVYIDGEIRYEYNTKDTRFFGSSSPDIVTFVPLHPWDNGKIVRMEFKGNNNYTGAIGDVKVGSQMAIFFDIYREEAVEVISAFTLMFMGVIAAFLGFFIRRGYNEHSSIGFLGWGIFMAGLWVICESALRQFLIPNYSLASYLTFMCIMLMPPLLALYFDSLQYGRYRAIYLLICIFAIVESVISIVLQFSANVDLYNSLRYSYLLFIADVVVYFITVIPDVINKKVREYKLEFVGICGAVIAAIVQMLAYIKRPENLDGRILCVGLIFLLSMASIRAFLDILKLERDKSAAEQASAASSEFLARMSHEMRTPINAILGMNKMILRESQDPDILEYARDVNGAGNHLLGIVNEVLDLAKVNSGNIEIEPKEYDLLDMLRDCYSMVIPRAKASRLAFVVEVDDVLPAKLYGDKERLEQVIINLLTNAVKYTPSGRLVLSVQGKVSDGKLMLIISVSDTGVGIKEDAMPYLFDSFKRVGNFGDKKIEGTGLGLAITKQLVELMHGKITVESTYGKGSTFTVIVPQGIRSTEPCGTFSMGPNGDRRVFDRDEYFESSGEILVVDDVAINLRVFSMLLKDTGITVDIARSGQETLDKITKTKYDIIFLDHLMPGMSGLETKKIMDSMEDNLNRDTPVIMQTANAIVGAKEQYLKLGFVDYITKPLKEEELIAMIKKYL